MSGTDTPQSTSRFNKFYESIDLTPLRELCLRKGVVRRFERDECFIESGEVCRSIGLLRSGYFKYCVQGENNAQSIAGFVFPNEFVADFSNSMAGMPAQVSVQAGRPTEILEISVDDFKELCRDSAPGLELSIMHVIFRTIYCRFLDIYSKSAKQRYIELEKAHHDLLRDVPLREIASYLLISPIHLSRIRRELLGK